MADYEDLISEIRNNRVETRSMLTKVVDFRNNIERLIPNVQDYKNRFLIDEKIKIITSVLSTELNIRKHLDDSVKTEFDLLKKKDNTTSGNIDIGELADMMETIKNS